MTEQRIPFPEIQKIKQRTCLPYTYSLLFVPIEFVIQGRLRQMREVPLALVCHVCRARVSPYHS